jgi:lipopolysaccharide/colanic/teichoic acid biosynthesis glycosyltransferase
MITYYQDWVVKIAEICGWLNIVDRSLITLYLASRGDPKTAIKSAAAYTDANSAPNHLIWRTIVKSIMDKITATLLIILFAPLFIIISIAIKLESPGPIFFVQKRVGFNGKLINILKFRTMRVDWLEVHSVGQPASRAADPRVTRVGRFLRRFSVDELPQLVNVLKGEMSLVGPRPDPIAMRAGDRLYPEAIEEYAERHRVKPGITGWAQVNGFREEIDTLAKARARVEHDLSYIEHWSLSLDLKILLMSIGRLLSHENAY